MGSYSVSGSPPAISRQTLHSAAADQKGSEQAARPSSSIREPLGGVPPDPDQAGAPSPSLRGRRRGVLLVARRDPDAGPGRLGHRAEPATATDCTSGQREVDAVYPLVVVIQSSPN